MNKQTIKFILILAFILIEELYVFAQNVPNERRVYYLDATYSMVSNKLWEPCKENLIKAIQNIEDSNTEVVVIVFADNLKPGDKVWKKWEEKATDQGKEILEKNIKGLPMPLRSTITNLYDPWNDFYSEAKKDKVNYMFLMTDGGHEQGGDFFGTIDKWKSKTDALTYGFFVELTENVGSGEVKARNAAREHIDAQKKERLWRVSSADVNLNLVRLGNEATYNVRNDRYIDIPVFLSGKDKSIISDVSFSCEGKDGFSLGKTEVSDGCIRLFINNNVDVSTYDESSNFKIYASLKGNDDKSILLTNAINVSCINKKERSLHLSETKLSGKMSHYDSFGFVKQKDVPFETTIELDWSQDAIGDKATFAEFVVTDKDGKILSTSDVEFSADGKAGNRLRVNPEQKELHLVISFPEGTKPGNHQGYLRLRDCKLDRFGNDVVSGDQPAQIEWRIKYDCKWNPLKLGLAWLVILLAAAFLLWMIVLKPIFYPRFGSIQKTFNVPGMAPLIVKFKGARMVVVAASHPKKQSGWNRFWTGKILYKKRRFLCIIRR